MFVLSISVKEAGDDAKAPFLHASVVRRSSTSEERRVNERKRNLRGKVQTHLYATLVVGGGSSGIMSHKSEARVKGILSYERLSCCEGTMYQPYGSMSGERCAWQCCLRLEILLIDRGYV